MLLSIIGPGSRLYVPPPTQPASADIFTADYDTVLGNYDSILGLGADSVTFRNISIVAGPKNLSARQTQLVYATGAESAQPYTGNSVDLADFTGSRFYRWYDWHSGSNNYHPADGETQFVHKRLCIGPDGGGESRMFLNFRAESNANPEYLGILDDWEFDASNPAVTYARGTWRAIQVEVAFGPGQAAMIKIWINNDTYASPTLSVTADTSILCANNGLTRMGFYSNDAAAADGVITFADAAFRVASTFDSNWSTWLAS